MIACFTSNVIGHVTPRTLLCWLDMMAHHYCSEKMVLKLVTVRRVCAVTYSPDCESEQAPDDEPLRPGDYVCCLRYEDTLSMIAVSFPRLPFNPSYTNHSHKFWQDLSEDQGAGDEPLALPEDSIDDSLRIEASRHGGGECAFTGPDKVGNTRVDVHWIFPPSMIIMISTWGAKKPFLPNIPDFRVSHNLLNMRDEIYQLWNSNAFSVDVDDEYRI